MSVCMSVRPSAQNNSAPAGLIFMKFDIRVFLENLSRKLKFHQNMTRITSTLHEDLCTFIVVYRWIFLGMINVSDNSRRENQNTLFIFNNFIFRKSFRLWDNMGKCGRSGQSTDENMIRCMPFKCWIPKDTDTHWKYVILIAFSLQQWLHERASVLRHTYTVCAVFT
jgi:hypothetical protein